MTTDWRALCAKLNAAYKQCMYEQNNYEQWLIGSVLTDRADAALAESKPEGPTDEELDELFVEIDQSGEPESWRSYARAILSRWNHPAPQPANSEVAKRLDRYDQALSAVMPPDFKDWWQNSKEEWPDIAAGVIKNLRQREELAWEQVERLAPQPS